MVKWGAYKLIGKDTTMGITKMPDRKKPCLYVQKKSVIYPLAYFSKEWGADMFWEEFKKFMGDE